MLTLTHYGAEQGKEGRKGEGEGEEGRLDGPDNGFDGTRKELLSRGTAGRGAVNTVTGKGCSTRSRNPGSLKSGSTGWGCRTALRIEEVVACLRCRKAGQSVVKK
jgi:hypothetical protein